MKGERKTKKQLLNELAELKHRVTELEAERARIEQLPDTPEARLWDLYENAPNAYFTVGTDGLIRRCNRRAGELLGYSQQELTGAAVLDLYTDGPHGKAKAALIFERFLAGDSVVDEELEMRRKDGTPIWVSLTVNAVCDADGQTVESRSMVVDITGRRQIESERERLLAVLGRRNLQLLTAAEVAHAASSILHPDELIQQAVDLVRERFDLYYAGLFLVDQTGEWTGEAGRWAVLQAGTGESGRQMVEQGHKLEIGRTSMIGWCVANRMARIALDVGEEAVRFDNPLLPDTRSELALPLGSRGEIIGALTIQSTQAAAFSEEDIAVLQTMADQLANAIANVQLFDQAQRELAGRKRAEEALRQYAAELEARNEDLDAFAHTVAHDLQNPLSLIVGCAQVLDESYDSMPGEQIQSCVRTIARNGRRMSNIIDELLLLSGLRQVEVDLKPLDMASIVAEARQRLANMIDERDAQIVLPKTWPVVIGHGPWVEEVWANLLSNAIKYGGQSPCVELGAELQRGNMVSFWVRDNGPGLLPEEQSRLFTPFTRLDQVQTKGYGLGLSIVQRIVEKLGGQVGIESETGKGSTFWFTLRAL